MLDAATTTAFPEPTDLFLRTKIDGIDLFGKRYICESRIASPPGYTFTEADVPGVAHPISNEQIWNWHESGDLRFVTKPDAPLPAGAKRSLKKVLSSLSKTEQSNILRRLRYCKAIDEAEIGLKRSADLWQPLCDRVAEKLGEPKQHWKTHYMWWLLWAKAGRDPRVLAGDERSRGRRQRRLTDLQADNMDKALQEWLDRKRPSFATAQHAVNAAITIAVGGPDTVKSLIERNKSPLIGYKAVRAELIKLGRATRLHYRHGPKAARQEITSVYSGFKTDLPLERLEADFKYLGLFVIDDETKVPLGTPYVAAAVDHFSGSLAGFDIGFDPPGSASAARLLANIIQRKTFDHLLKDEYGQCVIRNDWPVNGVPRYFCLDNDVAFHSTHLVGSAKSLGCDVVYLEPGAPSKKGMIESLWATVQKSYLDMFPGKRLRVFDKPGHDYKPEDYAVVSLKAVRTFLTKAFVDVHNQTKDERSGQIRIERYRNAALIDPPQPVPRHSDLMELVGWKKQRKATRKGVLIFGMFYNSDELASYRSGFRQDPLVEVIFSPDDIGSVLVIDRKQGLSIRVPCTLRQYANGLTRHQHRVIRQHAIDRGEGGRIYRQQLEAAKAELYLLGKQLFAKKNNRRQRQRMAHYFGMSPDMLERVTATTNDSEASSSLLNFGNKVCSEAGEEVFADEPDIADDGDLQGDGIETQARAALDDDEARQKPRNQKVDHPRQPSPDRSRRSPEGATSESPQAAPKPSVSEHRDDDDAPAQRTEPPPPVESEPTAPPRPAARQGMRLIKIKRSEK
jgi:putative transposase